MLRALVVAAVCLSVTHGVLAQAPVVILHITVVLTDADQKPIPVARHPLLISDNPSTSTPRRVVTGSDGRVDVRLRPGNYTVESDEPFALLGRSFQWTQTLDVPAGRDTVLELTTANAEVGESGPGSVGSGSAGSGSVGSGLKTRPLQTGPLEQLSRWRDSIVAVWSPTSHASGFLVDAKGLVLTNQQSIGDAGTVEIQREGAVKVEGRVVATDAVRDLALVWIDPAAVASVEPVPLACGQSGDPVAAGDEIVALGVSLRGQHDLITGDVVKVESAEFVLGSRLPPGSAGGPVFTTEGGRLVGITAAWTEKESRYRETRVVPIAGACDLVRTSGQKLAGSPPGGGRLPVEPVRPFPAAALKASAQRRTGSSAPYQLSSSDFEVSFITPLMIYAANDPDRRTTSKDTRVAPDARTPFRPPTDFGVWSEYFADFPPVLVIRVTPKMAESFWATLARGAAMTQGMSLPAMKRVKSGFSRVRVFCGDAEVTPIHPFVVESAVGPNAMALEGLYVFDPDAIGPHCAAVRLTLYSVKEPDRGDNRTVDQAVVKQIWQDFEPYRQP